MEASDVKKKIEFIKETVSEVIVGLDEAVEMMIVSMISGGHILLEGPPGLGKTTLANTFAHTIGGFFSRIQMTPDLLPSDVLGVNVYNPFDHTWVLRRGPIFGNVVLIDELNRASPKVQSAFLQVMQERKVTIENETMDIASPFMVIATQLPMGELGTYPLSSVQIDRFAYMIELDNPGLPDEVRVLGKIDEIESANIDSVVSGEEIMELMDSVKSIYVEEMLLKYMVEIVQDIRNNSYVRLGPSPRASIWLHKGARARAMMYGRKYVTPDDIKNMVPYVVPHRVELTREALFMDTSLKNIIDETLARVAVPKGLD